MLRAIGSEFQKVFTTRMWWLLALLLVGYVAFLAGGFGAFLGWAVENPDAAANAGNTQLPPGMQSRPADLQLRLVDRLRVPGAARRPRRHGRVPAQDADARRSSRSRTARSSSARSSSPSSSSARDSAWSPSLTSVGTGAAALAAFGLDTGLGEPDTWALDRAGRARDGALGHDRRRAGLARAEPGGRDRHRASRSRSSSSRSCASRRRSTTSPRPSASSCRVPRATRSSGRRSTASPRWGRRSRSTGGRAASCCSPSASSRRVIGGATTWRRDVT